MKRTFTAAFLALIFCGFSFAQDPAPKPPTNSGTGNGIGNGSSIKGNGDGTLIPVAQTSGETVPFRILSKARPAYTDEARKNGVEGVVRLRITFLASGEIGAVTPISFLPDGLTEQAVAAARNIKFQPQRKDGIPISVTKTVEYSFSIYFNENDKELAQNAEILAMPELEHSPNEIELQNLGGKIKVAVALGSDGTARVIQVNPAWSKELAQKVNEAVAQIKFNPAIHQNGNAVTQIKDIEYVFSESKK